MVGNSAIVHPQLPEALEVYPINRYLYFMQLKVPNQFKAVVTGGGSGLGRAMCVLLAQHGAKVVLADIDDEGAAETIRLVKELGAEATYIKTDVSNWDEVSNLEEMASDWLGGVDLLVNNAGVGVRGSTEKISLEDWEWVIGINLWGVVYGCKAFLPAMKANNRGYIINIASLAGLTAAPKMAPYNVSKSGVVSLSETICAELAHTNVEVSVVCPSFFRTNIMKSGRGSQSQAVQEAVDKLMDRSKVQAPQVAEAALKSVLAGKLYVLPMADARFLWRFKRFLPAYFQSRMIVPKKKR